MVGFLAMAAADHDRVRATWLIPLVRAMTDRPVKSSSTAWSVAAFPSQSELCADLAEDEAHDQILLWRTPAGRSPSGQRRHPSYRAMV